MTTNPVSANTQTIQTPSGRIAYTEQGTGPVALFVHGVLLNKHLWRHQLAHLSDIRRCIAVDLLAHGETDIAGDQDVSVTANAKMLEQFLDALNVEQADLVGNDSGGGIAQIFSALCPQRVRSLTLTDCDVHDNWPPAAFKPFLAMAAGGGLRGTLEAMLSSKDIYRSPQALGPAYEHPEQVTDESIETYLRPLVRTEQQYARPPTFSGGLRQRAYSRHPATEDPDRTDVDRLGNRRCVFRCRVVEVAGRDDSRNAAAARVRGGTDLFPRGTLDRFQ